MIKKFKNEENNLTPYSLLNKKREELLQNEKSLINSGAVKKCGSCFAPLNGFARLRSTSALRRKCAFSLAEAMIMLVIVTILMGLFAPLVAKKSAADLKNFKYLILPNNTGQELYNSTNTSLGKVFTSVFGALGDNQNFGIGTINREPNAKLHIQGDTSGADILNVTAFNNVRANGYGISNNASDDTGLFVRKRTIPNPDPVAGGNIQIAEVNIIPSCVPDWSVNNITLTLGANDTDALEADAAGNSVFKNDGYLLVHSCASVGALIVCPNMINNYNCILDAAGNCTNNYSINQYQYIFDNTNNINVSVLVPVNKNLVYNPNPALGINIEGAADANRFIPCVNNDGQYKAYKRGS